MAEDRPKPPQSAEELLRRYAVGERDFASADLPGAYLSGANLAGSDLSGANLSFMILGQYNTPRGPAGLKGASLARAKLRGALLTYADLASADLSEADLNGAGLYCANLFGATLRSGYLRYALLLGADLRDADISHANLGEADIRDADLRSANLVGAHLDGANLGGANLGGANLGEANLGGTNLVDIDLCPFAQQLNDALLKNGVTTFFFAKDAVPGKKLHRLMREGVNEHDRVILICSQASLDRPGVLNEITETLQREAREGGAEYLIPITVDDYVFSGWKPKDPGLAQAIRDRVVADFRGAGTDPTKFNEGLLKLIAALKK